MSAISFVQWSDDAPPGPGPGYTAWYDASQVTGAADGSTVHPSDLSGNSYHLTIGGCSYYKTTGTNLINGHPSFWFTGSGIAPQSSAVTVPFGSGLIVMQAVVRTTVPHTAGVIVGGTQCYGVNNGTHWEFDYGPGGVAVIQGGSPDTVAHVLTFVGGVGYGSISVDGTQVVANNFTNPAPTGAIALGSTLTGAVMWTGAIGEVIVYCAATLTAGQIAANEAYLKTKWGTP